VRERDCRYAPRHEGSCSMRTCRPKSLHRSAQPATTSPSLARSGCAPRPTRSSSRRLGARLGC
jgi:hypothetical protein